MAKRLGKIRSKSLLIAALMMVAIGGIAFTVPNDRYFQVQKNLDIFVTMFKEVNAFYVDEVDPEKLISEGINAMLATLDPYTVYIPEEQAEDYLFMTTNEYGGIGTSISKIGDRVVIAYPRSGYPAAESGIQQGDQILEVDGQSIAGLTTQEISSRLKGRPGTKVSILVEKAEGSAKAYELTRRRITIDNVPYSGIVESGIGYIRISDFTTNTSREVKQAMETLKGQGAEALVIDLRGNPGGLLSEAINVSNLFIEKGREVVSTKGRSKEWNKTYRALNKPVDLETPLVVLVGKSSASAAEIVAGVMQDYDRGILVGRQTFGKGLVQGTRPLSYDAQLKITTAKYYIPSGRCIQAIDYGDKGAEEIPDSLKVAFKTQNGREVYDGAGVAPDIVIESETLAPITTALLTSALIFDYVTEFRLNNTSIASPEDFELSDQQYNDFKKWVGSRDISYRSESEKYLEGLIRSAKTEELYSILKDDIEKLRTRVDKEKEDDLEEYKPQIKKVLEEQIVSYYYSEKGAIISALREDGDLNAAIQVLLDKDRYRKILAENS